ncbi:MAG: cytochrome c [Acidobacteria bacterium]|nr:cytochrome c [Acidobacteriota bacterium]
MPAARLQSGDARVRGRALFLEHCALCHGASADGRGERREGLARPPRDFTDPQWRQTTSARRVYFAIREGVQGSPMPAWKALDDDSAWDLVGYVLSAAPPR